MSTLLYIKLSAVMALEYAVWGAWMPVLGGEIAGAVAFQRQTDGVDIRHFASCVHYFAFDFRADCG